MPANETPSIRKPCEFAAGEFAQGIIDIIFEDQLEHDPDTQDMNRL
jgi:DNA-directed RNA polymerase subunit K/omega